MLITIQQPNGTSILLDLEASTLQDLIGILSRRIESKKIFKNCDVTISNGTQAGVLATLQLNEASVATHTFSPDVDPTMDLSKFSSLTLSQTSALSTALVSTASSSASGAAGGAGAEADPVDVSDVSLVPAALSKASSAMVTKTTLIDGIPTTFKIKALKDPISDSYFLFPQIHMAAAKANPQFAPHQQHIIFVTDDSLSMHNGERLNTQREIIKAVFEKLPEGTEFSLISIRTLATIVLKNRKKSPEDQAALFAELDKKYGENTDFYGAFACAKEVMRTSEIPTSATTILLCSDGGDSGCYTKKPSSHIGQILTHRGMTNLKAASADLILKAMIDDLAEMGLPGIPFVFFTEQNQTGNEHLKNLAATSYRSKQVGITVYDRAPGTPFDREIKAIIVDEIMKRIANGYHWYIDGLGLEVNEVTRPFPDGTLAKDLGIINPGASLMARALPVRSDILRSRSTASVQAMLCRGKHSSMISAEIEVPTHPLQQDDLLFTAVKQELAKLYSQDPFCSSGTKAIIETEIQPRLFHLRAGSRKDALKADIARYMALARPESYYPASTSPSRVPAITGSAASSGPAPSGSVQIPVRAVSGQLYTTEVPLAATIADFKLAIQAQYGIDANKIILICEGKTLQDEETVADANLASVSVVRMSLRQTPGPAPSPSAGKATVSGAAPSQPAATSAIEEAPHPVVMKIKVGSDSTTLNLSSNSTIEQVTQALISKLSVDVATMRVSLYAPRTGGLPLSSDCRLDTLNLDEEFLCQITPRNQTLDQVLIHCSITGIQGVHRGQVTLSGDSSRLTVKDLQTAINMQLCGNRIKDLSEFKIVLNGQALTNSAQKLEELDWQSATSLHVVVKSKALNVDTGGVLESFNTATALEPNDNTSTVVVLAARGQQQSIQFDNTRPLRELLSALLSSEPSFSTRPLEFALRSLGLSGLELDLDQSLSELGFGREVTFALTGPVGSLAALSDDAGDLLKPRLPSVVSNLSTIFATAGGAAAAASSGSTSTQNYTLRQFIEDYNKAREKIYFRGLRKSLMNHLISSGALVDFKQVFEAANSGSGLTKQVLTDAGVIDFTVPSKGTIAITIPASVLALSTGSTVAAGPR